MSNAIRGRLAIADDVPAAPTAPAAPVSELLLSLDKKSKLRGHLKKRNDFLAYIYMLSPQRSSPVPSTGPSLHQTPLETPLRLVHQYQSDARGERERVGRQFKEGTTN